MVKRVLSVFLLLLFSFAGVCVRIADLCQNSLQAANTTATSSMDIGYLRGSVYDCNSKLLTNSEYDFYAAVKPTNEALSVIRNAVDTSDFESVMNKMSQGRAVTVKLKQIITDTADIKVFTLPRRYGEDSLACHIIGYLDSEKNGISGVEKAFNDVLSKGGSQVNVRFSANANDIGILSCD